MWVGAAVLGLGAHVNEILYAGLNVIHFLMCATTDIGSLYIAIEKGFGLQANYAKVGSVLY